MRKISLFSNIKWILPKVLLQYSARNWMSPWYISQMNLLFLPIFRSMPFKTFLIFFFKSVYVLFNLTHKPHSCVQILACLTHEHKVEIHNLSYFMKLDGWVFCNWKGVLKKGLKWSQYVCCSKQRLWGEKYFSLKMVENDGLQVSKTWREMWMYKNVRDGFLSFNYSSSCKFSPLAEHRNFNFTMIFESFEVHLKF